MILRDLDDDGNESAGSITPILVLDEIKTQEGKTDECYSSPRVSFPDSRSQPKDRRRKTKEEFANTEAKAKCKGAVLTLSGSKFPGVLGLRTAWRIALLTPDLPGLDLISGNNRGALREVARLIHALCGGLAGAVFFLGSTSLGKLFGRCQRTALNWLAQLEEQGVIERTWAGRKCIRDGAGKEYEGGRLVNRASEFIYRGLPGIGSAE